MIYVGKDTGELDCYISFFFYYYLFCDLITNEVADKGHIFYDLYIFDE